MFKYLFYVMYTLIISSRRRLITLSYSGMNLFSQLLANVLNPFQIINGSLVE
jgi:hypothetical protein